MASSELLCSSQASPAPLVLAMRLRSKVGDGPLNLEFSSFPFASVHPPMPSGPSGPPETGPRGRGQKFRWTVSEGSGPPRHTYPTARTHLVGVCGVSTASPVEHPAAPPVLWPHPSPRLCPKGRGARNRWNGCNPRSEWRWPWAAPPRPQCCNTLRPSCRRWSLSLRQWFYTEPVPRPRMGFRFR